MIDKISLDDTTLIAVIYVHIRFEYHMPYTHACMCDTNKQINKQARSSSELNVNMINKYW